MRGGPPRWRSSSARRQPPPAPGECQRHESPSTSRSASLAAPASSYQGHPQGRAVAYHPGSGTRARRSSAPGGASSSYVTSRTTAAQSSTSPDRETDWSCIAWPPRLAGAHAEVAPGSRRNRRCAPRADRRRRAAEAAPGGLRPRRPPARPHPSPRRRASWRRSAPRRGFTRRPSRRPCFLAGER